MAFRAKELVARKPGAGNLSFSLVLLCFQLWFCGAVLGAPICGFHDKDLIAKSPATAIGVFAALFFSALLFVLPVLVLQSLFVCSYVWFFRDEDLI